jgi:hypothetical protein
MLILLPAKITPECQKLLFLLYAVKETKNEGHIMMYSAKETDR